MNVVDHLTFSLKHDGVNLAILAAVFEAVDSPERLEEQLVEGLQQTPHGLYIRRLWFFYEWLTGRTIALAAPMRPM